jgi:hypothetical protein
LADPGKRIILSGLSGSDICQSAGEYNEDENKDEKKVKETKFFRVVRV